MTFKTFNSWLTEGEENIPHASTVKTKEEKSTPETKSSSKEDIIGDVDNIINSLETLASELTIEHNLQVEDYDVNEGAAGPFGDMILEDPFFQLIGFGVVGIAATAGLTAKSIADSSKNKKIAMGIDGDFNKLRDMQYKSLKLEATILKLKKKSKELGQSISEMPAPKKASAEKLKQKIDNQIDSVEQNKEVADEGISKYNSILNQKYSSENVSGFFSGKVLKAVAGKREEIEKQVLKYKLKIYSEVENKKIQKDINARIEKLDQNMKKRQEELEAEIKKGEEKAKKVMDEASPEDLKELEAAKNKKEDDSSSEEETNSDDETVSDLTPEEEAREKLLQRTKDALVKAKESENTEEAEKLQALIDKIEAKESWQLNGTTLGKMLESELIKLENGQRLNESKYNVNSIKDAFKKLM